MASVVNQQSALICKKGIQKFRFSLEVCYKLISMKNEVCKKTFNQSKTFLIKINTSLD